MKYTKKVSEYSFGDLMTVEEFKKAAERGSFNDMDGSGHAVKGKKLSTEYIYPSTADKIPEDATHVMWFNK